MELNKSSILKSLTFFIPLVVLFVLWVLTKTSAFQDGNQELIRAVSIDLLVTFPIAYLIVIWRSSISKLTIIPVIFLGLIIGYQIIPQDHQGLLNFTFHWILPIVELSVFFFVVWNARKIWKSYKENSHLDFYDAMLSATSSVLNPKIAHFLTVELACIYFGLIKWSRKKRSDNEFTYHKNSSTVALLYIMIFIVGVELFVLHILLAENYPVFVWVLTGLSAYSGLQLLAFGKSLKQRYYSLDKELLTLSYGILSQAKIQIDNIDKIEKSPLNIELTNKLKTLSPFGLVDDHNILITLKVPLTFDSLYGFKKTAHQILLFVDDKERFIAEIYEQQNKSKSN